MSIGQLWLWGGLFGLVILSFAFPIPRELVGACVTASLLYVWLGPQRRRKTAALFLFSSLMALVALIFWDEHTFDAMTPAQHLVEAKKAQGGGGKELSVLEGLRHASAIPTDSPQKAEAATIAPELGVRLQELREAKKAAPGALKESPK